MILDEGYLLIEDESTIDDLLEAGVGERWHQEPTKQLVMVCKLKCNSGYKAMGDRTASCVLRTNEWYGGFDNAWCEEEEMDEGPGFKIVDTDKSVMTKHDFIEFIIYKSLRTLIKVILVNVIFRQL